MTTSSSLAWSSSDLLAGAPPSPSSRLNPPQASSSPSPSSPPAWRDLLKGHLGKDHCSHLSFVAHDNLDISLSEEDIVTSQKEWELSLIGYAVGRRPYYGALLAAFQRKWKLKGNMKLLSLDKYFFLFKFNCEDDFNLVFESGPCFLNGRPFLFKKWSWDFRLIKDDFKEIPEGLVAAFGKGLSTTCVVNNGAQVTSIICTEDGVALP